MILVDGGGVKLWLEVDIMDLFDFAVIFGSDSGGAAQDKPLAGPTI